MTFRSERLLGRGRQRPRSTEVKSLIPPCGPHWAQELSVGDAAFQAANTAYGHPTPPE